jgi:predicted lipoprotein with Yx(FWY)xxD motif
MSQLLSIRKCAVLGAIVAFALAAAALPAGAASLRSGAGARATVKTETSQKYGTILVSPAGRTLYLLTSTSAKKLSCTSSCAAIWPPLTTRGKPRAGKGVDAKMLGTVKRGDVLQVTYDGHRLYAYAGDTGKGQVNGEDISSFGGTWYVIGKTGKPVTAALASSGGASSGGGW